MDSLSQHRHISLQPLPFTPSVHYRQVRFPEPSCFIQSILKFEPYLPYLSPDISQPCIQQSILSIAMSAIPLTDLSTNRHPPPEPPAPSSQFSQAPSFPASSTDRRPHALLAPVTAHQSTNADTSNGTSVANNNAQHIPPAVTFAGVPYVDASLSVVYQAGRDIHVYPPTNGMCTLRSRYILCSRSVTFSHPPQQ